jgi:hypothetical protein
MPANKGAGNSTVVYNAVPLTGYVTSPTLTNAIAEIDSTVLSSTATESVAGLGSYQLQLEGNWEKPLDDVLGPDSISGTLRTAVVTFGSGANLVTYTWTTKAFITNYEITAAATDKLGFTATLRLNGAPTRV